MPETHGPTELHATVVRDPKGEALSLDDTDVLNLLWIAYAASFSPEEGRFPRVLIYVPLQRLAGAYLPFSQPIPLTEDSLRRLVPGVSRRPHGLTVAKRGTDLVLTGTVIPERTGYSVDDGFASWFTMNSHGRGLYLEIAGPGHLLVTDRSREIYVTQRLRNCTVSPVWDATRTAAFERLVDRVVASARQGGGILGGESLRAIVASFLASIVQMAIEARHGGAFAVVPDGFRSTDQVIANTRIEIRPAENGVLGVLDGFGEGRFGVVDENEHWETHHVHEALSDLWTYARSVGQLAALDGAVLLNDELAVIGAGVMTSGNGPPHCVQVDHLDRDVGPFVVSGLGSRNQSAARFCAATGATLFLVSEDGDLRIYSRRADGSVGVVTDVGFYAGSSPAFD